MLEQQSKDPAGQAFSGLASHGFPWVPRAPFNSASTTPRTRPARSSTQLLMKPYYPRKPAPRAPARFTPSSMPCVLAPPRNNGLAQAPPELLSRPFALRALRGHPPSSNNRCPCVLRLWTRVFRWFSQHSCWFPRYTVAPKMRTLPFARSCRASRGWYLD